jgi:ABC-type branched-subunit amino acid transport system substrate-binding protein
MNRRILDCVVALLTASAFAVPAAFAAGSAKPKPVKTGPGVTAKTITFGVLSDFSGVFASAGKVQAPAAVMYWNDVNRHGGVCGRKVQLAIQNTGYNPQTAVSEYQQIEPKILALQQLLGSPVVAAVLPLATKDHVVVGISAWSSYFLKNEYTVTTGATYDISLINGAQYFWNQGFIKKGGKVGLIYFAGDYGENAALGARFAADQLGFSLVEYKISPAVQDLSTQVASFKAQGVTAILLAVAPGQVISVGNAEKALGYDIPMIGPVPNYLAAYPKQPVADQLEKELYYSSPIADWNANTPQMKALTAEWMKKHGALGPDGTVPWAVSQAIMFHKALNIACARGDLTRDGFIRAVHGVRNVKTGLMTPLSFSVGKPSGTAVYIQRVADVPGGARTVAGPFTSPLVAKYSLP